MIFIEIRGADVSLCIYERIKGYCDRRSKNF